MQKQNHKYEYALDGREKIALSSGKSILIVPYCQRLLLGKLLVCYYLTALTFSSEYALLASLHICSFQFHQVPITAEWSKLSSKHAAWRTLVDPVELKPGALYLVHQQVGRDKCSTSRCFPTDKAAICAQSYTIYMYPVNATCCNHLQAT